MLNGKFGIKKARKQSFSYQVLFFSLLFILIFCADHLAVPLRELLIFITKPFRAFLVSIINASDVKKELLTQKYQLILITQMLCCGLIPLVYFIFHTLFLYKSEKYTRRYKWVSLTHALVIPPVIAWKTNSDYSHLLPCLLVCYTAFPLGIWIFRHVKLTFACYIRSFLFWLLSLLLFLSTLFISLHPLGNCFQNLFGNQTVQECLKGDCLWIILFIFGLFACLAILVTIHLRFKKPFLFKSSGSISNYAILTLSLWCLHATFQIFLLPPKTNGLGYSEYIFKTVLRVIKNDLPEPKTDNKSETSTMSLFVAANQTSKTDNKSEPVTTGIALCTWLDSLFHLVSVVLLFGYIFELFKSLWHRWFLILNQKIMKYDLYIFSHLNECSVALARSIKNGLNSERACLIFSEVSHEFFLKADDKTLRREVALLGNAIFNPKPITELNLHKQKSLVTIFFCNPNSSENLKDATRLIDGDRTKNIESCEHIHFHVLSEGPGHGRTLMSMKKRDSKGYFEKDKFTLFLDNIIRNTVYHLFDHHPLYFRLKKEKAPNVIVIGNNTVADECIRAIAWLGQMSYKSETTNEIKWLKPSLTLIAPDAEQHLQKLIARFKELEKCFEKGCIARRNLDLSCSTDWETFVNDYLRLSLPTYIIITNDSPREAYNLYMRLRIRLSCLRQEDITKEFNVPQIAIYCRDPDLSKQLKDFSPKIGHEHEQTHLTEIKAIPFGNIEGAYCETNLLTGGPGGIEYRVFLDWAFEEVFEAATTKTLLKTDWQKKINEINAPNAELKKAYKTYYSYRLYSAPNKQQSQLNKEEMKKKMKERFYKLLSLQECEDRDSYTPFKQRVLIHDISNPDQQKK